MFSINQITSENVGEDVLFLMLKSEKQHSRDPQSPGIFDRSIFFVHSVPPQDILIYSIFTRIPFLTSFVNEIFIFF